MTPSRIAALLIACMAVIYVAVILSSPRHTFWTIDGGFKFITAERLVTSSFQDVSIPYAGETLDPDGDFFPMKPPMATRVGGRFLPDVSLVFPILSALSYRLLSWPGLYLLPVLATLATLWLTFRMAKPFLESWAALAIPVLGLATPLFFYAVTFWEHSLAVFFTTAALCLLSREEVLETRGAPWAAGFALGAAIWFREECYLFAVAAFLGLLLVRVRIRTVLSSVAGSALAVLPLWLLQWQVLGKPFGKRVQGATEYGLLPEESGQGISGYFLDRIETLYAWTLGLHQDVGISLLVAAPLLVGMGIFLIGRRPKRLIVAWVAAAVYAALCLIVLGGQSERVFSAYFGGGLFPTSPMVALLAAAALVAAPAPKSRQERFLGIVVLVFFFLAIAMSPVKYQRGVHWGPRYLLPAYPAVAVLGMVGIRRAAPHFGRRRMALVVRAAVLALSLLISVHSITALSLKKRGTARTLRFFQEEVSDPVITNVWWFPLEVAAAYRERAIYGVTDTAHFHRLLDRFRKHDIERFTIVATPMDDRILRDPVIRVERVQPLVHPGMGYFDLLFCSCTLPADTD
jgi:hypothetical protein